MSLSPYLPTDRLRFLVEYGSSLSALRCKLKDKNPEKIRETDPMNTVEDIKRLKEELKTAKQSLVPPSYSLDKRGGDKVIEKLKGIVDDLIAVDNKNEGRYKELLEELDEMKEDRRLNLDSQKQQASGGTIGGLSPSSQLLPFDVNNNGFAEAFKELSQVEREQLLDCIPFAKLCNVDDFIPKNNVGISKGVLINWLIGIDVIGDPLVGEQFLATLAADPSFNLMRAYSSSRIIVSADFVRSLASLSPEVHRPAESKPIRKQLSFPTLLINVNSTCKLNDKKAVTKLAIKNNDQSGEEVLLAVHLGNFHRGMGHVVVEDTFFSEFEKLLKAEKHIGFLSLQGISRIRGLPHSVCELSELRVLDLRSCQDLKSLPKDIGRLIKLVCLDLSQCYQLDHIPKGIALLTNLRVLLGFILINDNLLQLPKDSNHAEFYDLKHLKKLIKLTIRTRRMMFPTNKDLKTLNSMQEIRKLKVAWVKSFVSDLNTQNEIHLYTQGLPKTLQKLELQAPPDTTVSRLLGLISKRSRNCSLEKLYIRGGTLQMLFSEHHCFPHVKILRLRHLHQLYMKWHDFQLSFPNLSYLHIAECPKLIYFPCDENGEWIQLESSW